MNNLVLSSNMNVEVKNFVKVWIAAITSLCYCFSVVKRIQPGILRLVSLLPIICLFITLPLSLSSFHLGAPTIFYLVWLGNFKLLLFAFDRGPLSSRPPLSFLHFISVALLPIKTRTDSSLQSSPEAKMAQNDKDPLAEPQSNAKSGGKKFNPPSDLDQQRLKISGSALMAIKVVVLAVVVSLYRFREFMHPGVIMVLYCLHVYLGVELILVITAVPVRAILGLEIEPQFNEPYLATSLQDFWGQRWNLMVTSILRPTVYNPIRRLSTRVLGSTYSLVPAVMATFLVSGLMHEVIYYYLTRASPTWEVTWFFIIHGVAVACEIALKKALNGQWRLPRAVSGPLTLGFVAVTGAWLFFPQVIRNGADQKAINEYSVAVHFVKNWLMLIPDIGEILPYSNQ